MSQLDDLITTYVGELNGLGHADVDEDLVRTIAKSQGPSIYNADSSLVSCSDQAELDRVKTNFLSGKLGLTDDAANQAACLAVCEQYKDSRQKKRVVFYYLLMKHLGVGSL